MIGNDLRQEKEIASLKQENERAINLLKKYEQWEADLISEDKMWWPFSKDDVITGNVWETMMSLQSERNELLKQQTHG